MINLHASLLPKLRGAAPIQHALIQGMTETGVSIMQLDEGLDTGPLLLRVATPIAPDETAGELAARLAELGALALVETLEMMESGAIKTEPQDHTQATHAPKITREIAHIPWDAPAEKIARLVRALDAKPGAWTTLGGREIKLFGPREQRGNGGAPGTVVATEPSLVVMTGSGALEFADVQPSGGNRMSASSWVRGRGVRAGQRFG
jgi:methionyl-tRNA formyltransferase